MIVVSGPVALEAPAGAEVVPVETAEETVTRKLKQFCKSRRELAHALAKRFNVDVPSDVERFFNAAESGRWEEKYEL